MDYRKIYKDLIERCVSRLVDKGVLYEKHHIRPRSFGGSDKKDNIVSLTLREHYIAHLLLVAIYPESPAMQTALWNMCNVSPKNKEKYERYKPSARMYNRIREDYIRVCSGEGAPRYNKKHTDQTKRLIGDKAIERGIKPMLGKTHSKETVQKIYNTKKRNGTLQCTEEHKAKLSIAIWGGKCYKAKVVICTITGKEYGSGRELSEEIQKPFSSVRRWLNGTTKPPKWFHYKRKEENIKRAYDQLPGYKNLKEDE